MSRHDSSGVPVSAPASRRASLGGVLGSGFVLLCCAGAAPVLGLLSAIGLGFLINDAVLVPLLLLALGVTGWGLWGQGRRCHGRHSALLLGLGGAALTVGGLYVWLPLAFVGFGAVMLASVWNLQLLRACTIPSSTSA
jgi:mercuric ion transport protein